MKKWIKGLSIGFLALGLAACSGTADVKPGTEDANKNEPTAEAEDVKTELTIGEVLEKAQASSEKLESMHAKMDIKQSMSIPSLGQEMDSDIQIDMDIVQEPLQMYQVMKMDMGEEGLAEIELYMTTEGFFMKDPESDAWMKLPEEYYEELMATMSAGADPTLDLEEFAEFTDDFTFEQNDNEYVLNLKASGEKFTKLIQEQLSSIEGMEGTEALEDMTIHQLDYEIFIDKETFDMTAFNLVMDMEMGIEEETIRIVQDMKAQISQINDIKEITVPQEILDSAVEQ